MKGIKQFVILLVIVCSVLLPTPAAARTITAPVFDDQVVLGGTFSLREGEVLNGNLVVIGGVVSLAQDSLLKGDIVAIGSNITSEGEVTGNLIGIGGVISLKETAVVSGDLIAPASVLQREEGATVYGQIITSSGPITIDGGNVPDVPEIPEVPEVVPEVPRIEFGNSNFQPAPRFIDRLTYAVSPIVQMMWFMFQVFMLSALAVVLILFVPEQARRASNVITTQPVSAGGLGLLTLVISVPLIILLAVTVILIPVSLLVVLVVGLGLFFGWVAVGQETGRRVGVSLGQDWSAPIQAGIGTFILTFVLSSLNFVFLDVIGWMLGVTVAAIGLGAVILTRFGTRDYIAGQVTAAVKVEEDVVVEVEPKAEETVEPEAKPKTTKTAAKPKTKPKTRKTATKTKASTRKKPTTKKDDLEGEDEK